MPLKKNFDKNKIVNRVKDNSEIGQHAAETWCSLIEPYVPYNTGRLCNDVTVKPFVIQYNAPYADTVYNDLKREFRKDKHPLAAARWSEVAAPAVKDYFVQEMQKFIDGMNLND